MTDHVRATAEPAQRTRPLALPEVRELRELRRRLAKGGLPPMKLRTPEDHARIATFRTMEELLAVLQQFQARREAGENCRLVEREHPRASGRCVIELVIEEVTS